MIYLKNNVAIEGMRKSCHLLRDMMDMLSENIKVGVTTKHIDTLAYNFIKKHNATPSFLNYEGFPASICASIDEELIHGFPSERVLEEGMLFSVDVGLILDGWNSDMARTFEIGKVSDEKHRLNEIAKQSFFEGVKEFKQGNRLGDISNAIQTFVEANGFTIVREFTGHGIGKDMHEDPSVPNFGRKGTGLRLQPGLALAIEPMVNMGERYIEILDDGWTVVSADRKPTAHYENTVVLTDNGAEILTL